MCSFHVNSVRFMHVLSGFIIIYSAIVISLWIVVVRCTDFIQNFRVSISPSLVCILPTHSWPVLPLTTAPGHQICLLHHTSLYRAFANCDNKKHRRIRSKYNKIGICRAYATWSLNQFDQFKSLYIHSSIILYHMCVKHIQAHRLTLNGYLI